MSSRIFYIIQSLVYLLLIAVLCIKIKRPYTDVDSIFEKYFAEEEVNYKSHAKDIVSYMDWHMHEPGQYEKVKPYYDQMLFVDSITQDVVSYLNNKQTKSIVADSLKQRLESYIATLLEQVPADSAQFSPLVDNGMRTNFVLKDRPNWVNNILKNQPASKHALLFDVLRSDVYFAEAMILKRLRELSHGHIDYYDTVAATILSTHRLYNIGEQTSAYFTVATLSKYVRSECYYRSKQLVHEPTIGHVWRDTAREVGDYTVSGFVRWYRYPGNYEYSIWDTLPWSYQYRVVAKGASLQIANQICYRNAANPISVSIPGYMADRIRLWAKGATVSDNKDGTRSLRITDKCKDKIIVYANATDAHGHTATIHAAQFVVRDLPMPILTIDGRESITVSAGDHRLSAKCADDDWLANYTVTSYDALLINADGQQAADYKVAGNILGSGNPAVRDAYQHLSAGAHIYLSNIKARTIDGDTVPVAPVGLVVSSR